MTASTSTSQPSEHGFFFTKGQREILESEFKKNGYPTTEEKKQIAKRANLTSKQVIVSILKFTH